MIHFTCKPFEQLTVYELYQIMALRQEVFIVEQNCPYLDADGKDQASWHLMAWQKAENAPLETDAPQPQGTLIAYTRLIPKGISYDDYASIGRVVNSPSVRGSGTGKMLMQKSLELMQDLFPHEPVKIGAQMYLLKFYEALGFESLGDDYLEDNIPHVSMVLKK